jgi:hypothetical protein
VPSFSASILLKPQTKGIASFFLNSATLFVWLGFLSSRSYNLDRIAVRAVALSFRFGIFLVLLAQWIALMTRRVYLAVSEGQASIYVETPWDIAALTPVAVGFLLCLLLDCSPHLPATAQIILTVCVCNLAQHQIAPFTFPSGRMVGYIWMVGLH